MAGRGFSGSYRFGYQGSEKDNEISGDGNSYTTEFRQLDPRLGRWFSVDPVFQLWQSPYTSMDNDPTNYNDIYGLDPKPKHNIIKRKNKNNSENSGRRQIAAGGGQKEDNHPSFIKRAWTGVSEGIIQFVDNALYVLGNIGIKTTLKATLEYEDGSTREVEVQTVVTIRDIARGYVLVKPQNQFIEGIDKWIEENRCGFIFIKLKLDNIIIDGWGDKEERQKEKTKREEKEKRRGRIKFGAGLYGWFISGDRSWTLFTFLWFNWENYQGFWRFWPRDYQYDGFLGIRIGASTRMQPSVLFDFMPQIIWVRHGIKYKIHLHFNFATKEIRKKFLGGESVIDFYEKIEPRKAKKEN